MRGLKKRRRVRLILWTGAALTLSVVFFGYAFRDGIQFFRTPAQVVAKAPDPRETFRLGGMVEAGSLTRSGAQVAFRVTDGEGTIAVSYTGITPDLFAEGEGVIATGRLENGIFRATEILAKHDENYMPRELAGLMADAK
ncbi:MAG: cytochrome c maturation protein CcmE [Alphaproteobacteria bacterium HGW-Alphaproteobacteria-6]|nr:MAG: cytochrome c maturation protein CcmE [Alphaproteobacteria bacterium HGW-Alphaproteobacteria-6]